MIGGIGMPELLVILVIILIIFGAGKLPEIGAGLGKGIRNFKKATSESLEPSDKSDKLEEKKSRIERRSGRMIPYPQKRDSVESEIFGTGLVPG